MTEIRSIANTYFSRFGTEESEYHIPDDDVHIITVIPCYNEPDVIKSLESLFSNDTRDINAFVILVINYSENDSPDLKRYSKEQSNFLSEWFIENNTRNIKGCIVKAFDLPHKHAGVGLARKIGMDLACRIFIHNNRDGIITCFDADSICDENYFTSIFYHFQSHPKSPACSIHYEHTLDALNDNHRTAVIEYELHLRYYVHILHWAGFIHAHQTIGSSMAVRAIDYMKQGGMNKRKAGEDFYFLHKMIPLGNFTNCTTTTVHPSPRKSKRVPFGTGKAIIDWFEEGKIVYNSYNPGTFEDLKTLLVQVRYLYKNELDTKTAKSILEFLESQNFGSVMKELRRQSTSLDTFINRFFRWFNGFMAMKYAHFCRDNYYPNLPVFEAVNAFCKLTGSNRIPSTEKQLAYFRLLDKANMYHKGSES